jgi:outer membrane protein OmpA-like peptidoglycan-associated protein
MVREFQTITALLLIALLSSCYPTPGPDKAAEGAVLGGAWGTGVGAVIGNQINATGPGALVGLAFGAGEGILTGAAHDFAEPTLINHKKRLDALEQQASTQYDLLVSLQELHSQDSKSSFTGKLPAEFSVFFDSGLATIRAGSETKIADIAKFARKNPQIQAIQIKGFTEYTVRPEDMQDLAVKRCKAVEAVLIANGISSDRIISIAEGTGSPIVSSMNPEERMLNRRVELSFIF